MTTRVLVVDDDAAVVELLVDDLEEHGFVAEGLSDPTRAVERLVSGQHHVLVSDVEMPQLRGLELLRAAREARPELLVILITAFGSIDLAVRALKAGAADFVTKPFRIEALVQAIERATRERRMRREIVRLRAAVGSSSELVAHSPSMRQLVAKAGRAAPTRSAVLLTGESGVGKGAVARFIHERSGREGAFVSVNCAALPESLAESELFGVRRGAFTDARADRAGLIAQANGGTLFLDEVGELSSALQPKLLHALETDRVRPLGASTEEPIDVRVIAATNRSLEEAVRDKSFRADLYYRLNVVRFDVPPLRERRDDILPLVDVLLARATARTGRDVVGITEPALDWLSAQPWPGNVRELSNVLERAVALAESDTLGLDDLTEGGGGVSVLEEAVTRGLSLDELEQAYVQRVLEQTGGNKSEAARILGIDRRTLYRKLEERPLTRG